MCSSCEKGNFYFFMMFFLAFLLLEYLRRFCPKIKIQQTLVFCLHLYYYEILVTNPSEIRNLRYDMSFNDINQAMAKGLLLWRLSRHQFNSFSCSRSQLFKANFHFFYLLLTFYVKKYPQFLSTKSKMKTLLLNASYWYQFGCGISKMVGPKKQDYWPKINILEGGKNKIVLKNVSSSKNGHDFSNKVAQ